MKITKALRREAKYSRRQKFKDFALALEKREQRRKEKERRRRWLSKG